MHGTAQQAPKLGPHPQKDQENMLGFIVSPPLSLSSSGKWAIWPQGWYVPGTDLPFLITFPGLIANTLPALSHSSVGMNHPTFECSL